MQGPRTLGYPLPCLAPTSPACEALRGKLFVDGKNAQPIRYEGEREVSAWVEFVGLHCGLGGGSGLAAAQWGAYAAKHDLRRRLGLACEWYERAASGGDPLIMREYAEALVDGYGAGDEAAELWRRRAERAEAPPPACNEVEGGENATREAVHESADT